MEPFEKNPLTDPELQSPPVEPSPVEPIAQEAPGAEPVAEEAPAVEAVAEEALSEEPATEEAPADREPAGQEAPTPLSDDPAFRWSSEPAEGTAWHATKVPDSTWRREPEPSPFADSPYVTYDEARESGTEDQWRAAFQDAPQEKPPQPPRQKTKKKRKIGAKTLVAVALIAAILGGALGAGITGSLWNHQLNETLAGFQQQLEEVRTNGNGVVIHTTNTTVSGEAANPQGMLSPSQVYEQNVQSVVSITTQGYSSNGYFSQPFTSTGSGFVITVDGYVLTNYHVIESYQTVEVTTMDGTTYAATVVGYDSFNDVALLKIEGTDMPHVTLGDSDVLAVGDQVAAIGNPLGELASSQTVGYVSAKNRQVNTDGTIINMIQTDAAINSGNSGGPLFNMYGQVIGITTAKYSGSSSSGASIEGIGFAISINTVVDMIDDLMNYGYITNQAYLGIELQEMDASVAASYGLPAGPRITNVVEGYAAHKAGIQVGDIITAVGDVSITSYSELSAALRTYKAGDTTTVSIFRAGQTLELTVTFDERPSDLDSQSQVPEGSVNNGSDNGGIGAWPFP